MTEKLLTGTLSFNTNKKNLMSIVLLVKDQLEPLSAEDIVLNWNFYNFSIFRVF